MPNSYDVFISSSRKDAAFVNRLVGRLHEHGISTFYDQVDMAVGEPLFETLENAVTNARFVLVVLSPDYIASVWTTLEWQIAVAHQASDRGKRVIPILLRDCEIPPILAALLYADFRSDAAFEQNFQRLVNVLGQEPKANTETRHVDHFGAVSEVVSHSPQLAQMVAELQAKVDALVEPREATESKRPGPDVDTKLCFVAMPFGSKELNDVYAYFVKPSIEKNCNLRCERGDDMFGSNPIMDDIRRSIERARLIIADLTGRNPNVFYEVGIAHTLSKDVLLLSQSMNDVPFDLRHLRVLVYEYSPKGCRQLEDRLAENVNAIVKAGA